MPHELKFYIIPLEWFWFLEQIGFRTVIEDSNRNFDRSKPKLSKEHQCTYSLFSDNIFIRADTNVFILHRNTQSQNRTPERSTDWLTDWSKDCIKHLCPKNVNPALNNEFKSHHQILHRITQSTFIHSCPTNSNSALNPYSDSGLMNRLVFDRF